MAPASQITNCAAFQPLRELDEDAGWHRAWTAALLRHLIDDTPANAELVSGWIEKWRPLVSEALEAFAGVVAGGGAAHGGRPRK